MRLAVLYGAALALLAAGLRELLMGSEENRCSMTYMYEYPEYRVSARGPGVVYSVVLTRGRSERLTVPPTVRPAALHTAPRPRRSLPPAGRQPFRERRQLRDT